MSDILPRISAEFNNSHPDFLYADNGTTVNVDAIHTGLDKSFLGFVGSQSHGTYVPKDDPDSIDDIDIMGVVPLPASHLFGLKTFDNWTYKKDDLDVVVYSLPKFVNMLLKGNPNVMGLLWLSEGHHLQAPEWWNRMVLNRDIFASKKNVYNAFVGYAKDQMEKMVSYTPKIDEEIQELEHILAQGGMELQHVMNGVHSGNEVAIRYRTLSKKFHFAYMGDKRKQLVRKHGYDSKNAAHMIRLLSMAIEYLNSGTMFVDRTDRDADMLKEIKRGEWSLEQVKGCATNLFSLASNCYDRSLLPEYPDYKNADDLLAEIAQENC